MVSLHVSTGGAALKDDPVLTFSQALGGGGHRLSRLVGKALHGVVLVDWSTRRRPWTLTGRLCGRPESFGTVLSPDAVGIAMAYNLVGIASNLVAITSKSIQINPNHRSPFVRPVFLSCNWTSIFHKVFEAYVKNNKDFMLNQGQDPIAK